MAVPDNRSTNFEAELARLNEFQRAAVEQVEGALLVVAGPGTGKTQLLSARIGRILQLTDAYPHNILCLTYTDAGVRAMRQRLLQLIGATAHKVHIYTFHSFCNSVIQHNTERFGHHALEPISELEQITLLKEILDELPMGHPLVRSGSSDAYYYQPHLRDLFKRMKAEGWSPEYVARCVNDYLTDLPLRKEFVYQTNGKYHRKGELKQALLDEAHDKMERLTAAAALFLVYQQKMAAARRYDFDDMVLWVLQAFERDEALLRRYQEQYLYLLVDEYQDTNGTQNALLQKLADFWESPNVFVVGDDDQSIFEFQGARLKNILNFYTQYAHTADFRLILLRENYRSSQHILDAARSLIAQNKQRLVSNIKGLDKILVAKSLNFADAHFLPTILEYDDNISEIFDIVERIKNLQNQHIPLAEMAVIYAQHRQADLLIEFLNKKNISYITKRPANVLHSHYIRYIRLFLNYIQKEATEPHSGETMLFELLHADFLGISPNDLAIVQVFMTKQSEQEPLHWRDCMNNPEALSQRLHIKKPQPFLHFSQIVEDCLSDYYNRSVKQLIERFINQSGLLAQVLDATDREWQLQVLSRFFHFIEQETPKYPNFNATILLETLQGMDDNRLALTVEKTLGAEGGVQLLTAHSAKGLEFRVVFMIDCVKDYWEPSKKANFRRFSLPDTLTFSLEEDAMEARRRLFYVAITRAQERLYMSYATAAKQNASSGGAERVAFIDEILNEKELPFQRVRLQTNELAEARTALLLNQNKTLKSSLLLEQARLDALLQTYTLSISGVDRYLRCPLSFYYTDFLKVPSNRSEAAFFGNGLHLALKRFFDKMRLSKKKDFPDVGQLLIDFEEFMNKNRHNFTSKTFQRQLEAGKRQLQMYYEQHIHSFHKNVLIEYEIRHVAWEGIPLVGTLDKVELHENPFDDRIVDYKTGRYDATKLKRPTKATPKGGSYWRQLVFYKILYENYQNTTRRARFGEISYLEPDRTGKARRFVLEYTPDDVLQLGALLQQVWADIQSFKFEEGCGKPDCKWCNFAKRASSPPESFRDEVAETLDDGS